MEDVAVVVAGDRRKAIEELVRGHEFAKQLRQVIKLGDDESAAAILRNVLTSFANTLFHLNKYPTYQSHDEMQVQPQEDSCLVTPAKSEDSLDSPTPKDRRGCYKRKRSIETWKKVSESPTDHDGHQWRKYGQKPIQNAKYSRNYYRCTHKYDQGCQATKQVQRVQEEPPLYRTTYYGHHTCRNLLKPEIMLDSTSASDSAILLSFDNSLPNPINPFLSSSLFHSTSASVKEEYCSTNNKDEEVPSSTTGPTLDNWSRLDDTLIPTLDSDDYWDVMMSGDLYGSVDDDFQPFVGF